jgi:hypothetical protein
MNDSARIQTMISTAAAATPEAEIQSLLKANSRTEKLSKLPVAQLEAKLRAMFPNVDAREIDQIIFMVGIADDAGFQGAVEHAQAVERHRADVRASEARQAQMKADAEAYEQRRKENVTLQSLAETVANLSAEVSSLKAARLRG